MAQSLAAALTRSPEETERFGAALARCLPDLTHEPLALFLDGDLGAGKTTLARGLLRELGASGSIRSPSYALVESYAFAHLTVVHVDLYRLRDAEEVEALALRELHTARHLWIVEWADKARLALPEPDLALSLDSAPDHHRIAPREGTPRGWAWFERARAA